jgi:hypothetical protein
MRSPADKGKYAKLQGWLAVSSGVSIRYVPGVGQEAFLETHVHVNSRAISQENGVDLQKVIREAWERRPRILPQGNDRQFR